MRHCPRCELLTTAEAECELCQLELQGYSLLRCSIRELAAFLRRCLTRKDGRPMVRTPAGHFPGPLKVGSDR